MTIQKALEIIKNEVSYKSGIIINKALKTVESAVGKEIPRKPITETVNRGISVSGEYDIDFNYLCPNCNTVVGDYETDDAFYKFCPDCGQALDWSECNG